MVIEEYLDGPEVSLFAVTDGRTVLPLLPAQDFKRARDGDAGPNTGGMGAYTPLPWAPADLVEEVTARVLQPTVDEMARRGTPFAGLLYAGLALTGRGVRVVEFNARFGDPETQPLLALLASPLGVLLKAAAEGRLDELGPLTWHEGAAVAVVVAAADYPARRAPATGSTAWPPPNAVDGVDVLHAGTASDGTATSSPPAAACSPSPRWAPTSPTPGAQAYAGVDALRIDGSHHRTDIAAGV